MNNSDIAIIGFAGKFPGAKTIDDYWNNLVNKVDSVIEFETNNIHDSNYIPAKGYLEDADLFDAEFFRFSPHEAKILDPQYRIFIETVWEALENAACNPDTYPGKIGIFAGSSNINSYYQSNLQQDLNSSSLLSNNFMVMLNNAKDFLANIIAYKLNLDGPAISIQTACSTSLVAVCVACQNLLSHDCDVAIAGGTCVTTPLKAGYTFQTGMMLSPTGKCRTFDATADGITLGNGCGAVILKRLEDAKCDGDTIHAVINGYATRHDGSEKIGFTAPSIKGQAATINDALAKAKIAPNDISYIETHGTGTILGDLIEIEALNKVYKNCKRQIALGSVKTNIGHLDAASGIAGLIKTILALKKQTLPANLHFNSPSPRVNFSETPFYVNTETRAWQTEKNRRYAGVSSFGMGGTNAHIILCEYENSRTTKANKHHFSTVILLSARTQLALSHSKKRLAVHLKKNPYLTLTDIAHTLAIGRKAFNIREAIICSSLDDLIKALTSDNHSLAKANDKQKILINNWLKNKTIDLAEFSQGHKIPLPSYPFQRKRFWIDRDTLKLPKYKAVATDSLVKTKRLKNKENIENTIKEIFEKHLFQKPISKKNSFAALGGDSFSALLIMHDINKKLKFKVPVAILENSLSIESLSEIILTHMENQ